MRNVPISFSLGLTDLTSYTGDGVRLIGGAAMGVSF